MMYTLDLGCFHLANFEYCFYYGGIKRNFSIYFSVLTDHNVKLFRETLKQTI